MKIEVTLIYNQGSLTFTMEALFHGDGTMEEGITAMLEDTYPNASHISFEELNE